MDFIYKAKETITKAGKGAADKAKEISDVAKMKMELKSKEDFIERQYIEIGKKVFETEKDAESSAFEEVFVIKQTMEEIKALNTEIAQAKGFVKCAGCGADIDPDVAFCPACGAKNE